MNLYEDQFDPKHDFPHTDKTASKVLIIASTARSGSHMLGHVLHETGCFGYPLEYANPQNLARWREVTGKHDIGDVLHEIQQRRTSPNGLFSIKIHYDQIAQFGGFDRVLDFFPDAFYIVICRQDVLRQAISFAIAQQTGVWIAGQKPVNEHPQYDFERIDRCLRKCIKDTAAWRYVLSTRGCTYREVTYENLLQDLPASIEEIAEFVGVRLPPERLPQQLVTGKQAGSLNSDWERRFLAQFRSRELFRDSRPRLAPAIKRVAKQIMSGY